MNVLVISMESRFKNIKKTLDNNNITFERIIAVDGIKGTHPLMNIYNDKEFTLNRRRHAAPGEIGCYASHILAWRRVCKLNKQTVILEDDVEIFSNFNETIHTISQWERKLDFIRLEPSEYPIIKKKCCRKKSLSYKISSIGNIDLLKFSYIDTRTTGYIISPKCARAFLNASQSICMPVDIFIRWSHLHKQALYGITQYCVARIPKSENRSLIGHRRTRYVNDCHVIIISKIRKIVMIFLAILTNIFSR